MSFGIPCPEEPGPAEVYTGIQSIDTGMGEFVQGVMSVLLQQQLAIDAGINSIVSPLVTAIGQMLKRIDRLLNEVVAVLQAEVTGKAAAVNVSTSVALQEISQATGTPFDELIYGPQPQPTAPGGFPPTTQPTAPAGQPFAPPGYPPGFSPTQPAPTVPPPNFPPAPTQIIQNGSPISVTPVCPTIPVSNTVLVGGSEYQPTFDVAFNPDYMVQLSGGSTTIQISYDVQPDGTLAIHVGPISVIVKMPPTDRNPNAAACQLFPS